MLRFALGLWVIISLILSLFLGLIRDEKAPINWLIVNYSNDMRGDTGYIARMWLDGSHQEIIYNSTSMVSTTSDGQIVIQDYAGDYSLSALNIVSGKKKFLIQNYSQIFRIHDGWIYFSPRDQYQALDRVNISTGVIEHIIDPSDGLYLSGCFGCIFSHNWFIVVGWQEELTNDLFRVRYDSSEIISLSKWSGGIYSQLITKDSKWIIFWSDSNDNGELYRVRTDGTGVENLTNHPDLDQYPVLSPDGKWLYFERGSQNPQLYRLNLETKLMQHLEVPDRFNHFIFSPNGKWIFFYTYNTGSGNKMWRMYDSGIPAKLVLPEQFNSMNIIDFSPDGKKALLVAGDDYGWKHLYWMDVETFELTYIIGKKQSIGTQIIKMPYQKLSLNLPVIQAIVLLLATVGLFLKRKSPRY